MQHVLDSRYLFEKSLASSEDSFVLEGTCGACVCPTTFTAVTAGGEETPSNQRVPNWRETLRCGCSYHLPNRYRAVLHFLKAKTGLQKWMRVAIFGSSDLLASSVEAETGNCHYLPRLVRGLNDIGQPILRLEDRDRARHIVISLDYLHLVPMLRTALFEVLRILESGGRFIFTIPFHAHSELTSSFTTHLPRVEGLHPAEFGGAVHDIGWDILSMLRDVGFSRAAAYLYWSEELGYFGPYNFIFSATR